MMGRPATGLTQRRHGNRCTGKRDCGYPWRVFVYSETDGKKIRKTFPICAAAKVWRDDMLGAATRAALRAPNHTHHARLIGSREG